MPKQERLFDPGPRQTSPWKLHPDKWVEGKDVVYHASDQPELPRKDRGSGLNVGYGGSEGMHFGTKHAAVDRATTGARREHIHTARLSGPQFTPEDDAKAAHAKRGIPYTPSNEPNVWSDDEANNSIAAYRAVKEGKVVPYKNTYEGAGSTSYRARADAVRTWSEDVQAQPNAAPALQYLADKGYNPTLKTSEAHDALAAYYGEARQPQQQQLWDAELTKGGKTVDYGDEDSMFGKMHTYNTSNVSGVRHGVVRRNAPKNYVESEAIEKARPRLRRPD